MLNLCSPMLALELLSPIAVTEKAGVGTGSPQAGAAAGAAALITFGYQPKASGKDTGCGRRPDLKADA